MWEPYDPFSYFSHVLFGVVAYSAGLVAIASLKGSPRHVRAGRIYASAMAIPVVTTFVFLLERPFPLVVVLAVASGYLIASAVLALRSGSRYARIVHWLMLPIPIILTLFATRRFLGVISSSDGGWLGPLLIAGTFGALAVGDLRSALRWPTERRVWIIRHLQRMVLSFGFATMAVFRLGIDTGLSLEVTVVVPLILSLLAVLYFRTKVPEVVARSAAATRAT